MTNRVPRVLLTGDYWHSDFQELIASATCVTTLVPECKVSDELMSTDEFDLVVIAASRRNQFSMDWVEQLRSGFAPTPVVALLGSWCEGEQRSGTPWPGVKRVYWHQWRGRFDQFAAQVGDLKLTAWNLPDTANDADIIQQVSETSFDSQIGKAWRIGISSLSETGFGMLEDALTSFSCSTFWVERQQWNADATEQLTAVVVEADSWDATTAARIDWLRDDLEIAAPIVITLNFPRRDDVDQARAAGVQEVVSKPFQLMDVAGALERAIAERV